jgi:hypothetical protein
VRGVADQNAAEQVCASSEKHQLGVGLVDRVVDRDLEADPVVTPIASPKLATSTPSSLSFGRHIGLGELRGDRRAGGPATTSALV